MIHELKCIQIINSYTHSKINDTNALHIYHAQAFYRYQRSSNHQSINYNRLNNMNRDVNAKISSSQVHAEFLKIDLRKEVL